MSIGVAMYVPSSIHCVGLTVTVSVTSCTTVTVVYDCPATSVTHIRKTAASPVRHTGLIAANLVSTDSYS